MPESVTLASVLRTALLIIATAAILTLAALFLELRAELQSFQEEPVDNIHWNVTQLELDAVRLEAEAQRTILQADSSLDELRRRFDLFYSRAQTATKGRVFTQPDLARIIAPMKTRLAAFLDAEAPVIDSDDAILRAHLPDLERDATALREDLRVMSVELIDQYAALGDQRRAAFSALVTQAAWASAGVFAVLALLLVLALWLNRQAERNTQEIRRVSSRLAATVDTSLDAIIVAGPDGRILDYNAAAETIFGYARAEVIGVALGDLIVPPDLRGAHDRGMERMSRTGQMHIVNTGRIQITAMRKGGQQFPVELSIVSTQEADGTLFISYLRDISSRVAAERAVVAARDEAIVAEQAKTSFMAVMSHEMRTPLNGVMASLEIAARQTVDAGQARFLALARNSAEQLLRHVNEVLDIAKIDTGHLTLTEEVFDLAELVQTQVATQAQSAAQNGTALTVAVLSALPPLQGDAFRLGQILQNYLSNAIKFTSGGRIEVEVEGIENSDATITVELRVSDTGIGIAEADQLRVFDDFVMLDPSYSRTTGGSGLGLAIVRRLAHALQGEVGVESEPGAGSCFWARIPFRRAAPTAPAPAQDQQALPVAPRDVLVVEDNATNRIVLEEMLRFAGHRVSLAANGLDGLNQARAHRFDVILMDVSMPLMDGIEAARLIRAEGQSRAARIIAVTAQTLPQDRARFEAAGMDGYLGKPISGQALAKAIAGIATGHAARSGSAAILDADRLQDLAAAMGQDGIRRMTARFRGDLPGLVQRLEEAAAQADGAALMQAAHEGAGASAMFGAAALGQVLRQIETLCRKDQPAEAARLVAEVRPLVEATVAALAA